MQNNDKKKKLGKGLQAIFGDPNLNNILDEINSDRIAVGAKEIDLNLIYPNPYQPRKNFDDASLKELAESIKINGLISPILVKKLETGKFYIVAGERRFRATKLAGLSKIAAIEVNYTEEQMREVALIENIQRVDLTPIEEARAYQEIIEWAKITQEQLAQKINKSRTYVTNIMRLLSLPSPIIDFISEKKLEASSARALIGLEHYLAIRLARQIIDQKLNTRQVEELIKSHKKGSGSSSSKGGFAKPKGEHSELSKLLETKINAKVTIQNNKIQIDFKDDDHLMKIFEKLEVEFE